MKKWQNPIRHLNAERSGVEHAGVRKALIVLNVCGMAGHGVVGIP